MAFRMNLYAVVKNPPLQGGLGGKTDSDDGFVDGEVGVPGSDCAGVLIAHMPAVTAVLTYSPKPGYSVPCGWCSSDSKGSDGGPAWIIDVECSLRCLVNSIEREDSGQADVVSKKPRVPSATAAEHYTFLCLPRLSVFSKAITCAPLVVAAIRHSIWSPHSEGSVMQVPYPPGRVRGYS